MSENLIVAKFGGTSVSNYIAMNRSADVVSSNRNIRLVVLSASSGVTDRLIALAEGKKKNSQIVILDEIFNIQDAIIKKMKKQRVLYHHIQCVMRNIVSLSESAERNPSLELTDELMSYGEIMSTLLFVEILRQRHVMAEWFDVRRVMRTNSRFGCAEPHIPDLLGLVNHHLKPRIKESLIVTQGFIGQEKHGRTTTLGRGGSDYTASILGEALHAHSINIWTDVSGIYTTDPRLVPSAKRIDKMTFEEASVMATFGAKVLHPSTLLPALRSDMSVFVGSSKNPMDGGTIVCNKMHNLPVFRAITLRRQQILLTLRSRNILCNSLYIDKVFKILACHSFSLDLMMLSDACFLLTLDSTRKNFFQNSVLTQSLLDDLSFVCDVEIEDNLALVVIIGNQISGCYHIRQAVFSLLNLFNIRLMCYRFSRSTLCYLVHGHEAEQIIQILHRKIFEEKTEWGLYLDKTQYSVG
ncbi:lysine-sensitive aspartokinase 3 [Candidatus Erwinia haradaeae]|uniref:Aspartokinase n=1 Tax=Candidatus Erwinia haradaeae TaxID=1922217 RepID=A0A451D7A7_9GAMM|nr:lysine-sensitive aspartokinase 3 [Candidatus Erwinia haradaeae]VFP81730.1 Lysine-sensitive aspartokinase 3 [Candidatus Erwinia haradaeae]